MQQLSQSGGGSISTSDSEIPNSLIGCLKSIFAFYIINNHTLAILNFEISGFLFVVEGRFYLCYIPLYIGSYNTRQNKHGSLS